MPSNGSWQKVRFDQICKNISNRIDDPKQADTDYYVGLEHLDSEEPKILRHGSPNDVGATKLRFKPGQILFGKRRWYLRKLAVAQREGICSAHMMVLEPIGGKITKEFLSILMQGEDFFEKARRVSAGSLSPTIKWKDLAKQEFRIPPIPEQETILSLTHQIDDAISKTQNLLEKTKIYFTSRRESLLTRGIGHTKFKKVKWLYGKTIEIPEEWDIVKLGSVCKIEIGNSAPQKNESFDKIGVPFIRVSDMSNNKENKFLSNTYDKIQKTKGDELNIKLFSKNSIIVPKSGISLLYNYRAILSEDSYVVSHIAILNAKNFNNQLLFYIMSNIDLGNYVNDKFFPALSKSQLEDIDIFTFSENEQQKIASILSNIDDQISQQQSHLSNLKTMRKSIINSKLTKEETIVAN